MEMTALGLAVFVVITGTGQLYFSHKRKKIFEELHAKRKKLHKSVEILHEKA